MAFSLRDAVGSARVSGSEAVYPDAFAGVDVSYEVRADALKELIVLKSASARREFVFDVTLSDGLRPVLESGALAIRDASGALKMSVPAPFMSDARGDASHAVSFALARVQSGWRLTLSARDAWLDAPGRAWPVTIDPEVSASSQADCKLNQAQPTTDFCAMSHLEVGGPAGGERRSALRFDVDGAVPNDAQVTFAFMELKLTAQSASTPKFVNVHELTRPIAAGATWNSPWTTAGGDFAAAVACTSCPYVGGAPGGGGHQPGAYVPFFIDDLVTRWADGRAVNNGLLIKTGTLPADGNVMTFASSEVPGSEPHLFVRYQPRTGVLPAHKYESQQLTDRLSLAVNSSSGNLLLRARDLTVPGGLGPDLTVARSFNSLQSEQGRYGPGWNADSAPDLRLDISHQEAIVLHGPSGFGALFRQTGPTSYLTPTGFNATLEKTPTGWTYTENASQRKLTFDSLGRLTRDQDRNNRALTFTYTGGAGSQLHKITDAQGRETTFAFSGGRITQMTDSAGRQYKYFYNATTGALEKYTDPDNGDTLLTYDATGLRLITTPAGRKTKITYHGPGPLLGRVASVVRVSNPTAPLVSMTGPTTQFTYTINQDGSGSSVVTDPRAKTVTTVFNASGWPTRTTDGENRVTSAKYTTNANVESYTVAGNTGTTPNSALLYDTDNNLTGASTPTSSTTDPATCTSATCVMSSARYGESTGVGAGVPGRQYLLTSTTNAQGRSKTLTYDAGGNPKTIGSSLGTITLHYDPANPGKLTSIVDQRSKTTSYTYDTAGNLTQVTPPLPLGTTTLTYTASLSRIATMTDANNKLRTLAYDSLDRVTKITYHDGTFVQFVYDKDGNLTARNDSVAANNSSYTYDERSLLRIETLPGGVTNTYAYDLSGNLETLTDAGGTVTYGYDGANRNISVLHATQNIGLAFTDQAGTLGPTATTSYPNTVSVTRRADYAGRLIEIKATKAGATIEHLTYEYTDGSYGEGALRVRATDVLASKTTRYQYDTLDRLTRARTYASGTAAPADALTCADAPRLGCYEYALDAAGNRTQRTAITESGARSTTTYAHNDANQITARTVEAYYSDGDLQESSSSTYAYDANGNHAARTGAYARTLGYNLRDQTINLNGIAVAYLGAGQDQPAADGSTTLQHNVLGLSRRTPSGATASYYTRDEGGTLLAQRTGTSREYYIADALGSTTRTTDSTGTTQATYAYDPDGNTTSTTGTSSNPFKYASGYLAPAGLYRYGQRYYDPMDARWTQPDPLDQPADLRQAKPTSTHTSAATPSTSPTRVVSEVLGGHVAEIAATSVAGGARRPEAR